MRHRKMGPKLTRTSAHRWAMFRNLVTSLLDHERVETTDAKAKAVRRIAERMITLGKRGDLHARRRALRVIRNRDVAAKVFGDLADRFRARPGGYTRVTKLRRRVGDAAELSLVTLVEGAEAEKVKAKPKVKPKAKDKDKDGKAGAKEPKAKAAKTPGGKAKAKLSGKEEKKPRERRKKAAGKKP